MVVTYRKKCDDCGRNFVTKGARAILCPHCRGNRYKKPGPLKEEERREMRQQLMKSETQPLAQMTATPYNKAS